MAEPVEGSHRITCTRVRELFNRAAIRQPAADSYAVLGPWDQRLLYELPLGAPEDVATAMHQAREAQRRWAGRPVRDRLPFLRRLRSEILQRADEAMDVIQLESGKARGDAYEEVADVALVASYTARAARTWLAPQRAPGSLPLLTSACVHRHPHGVVGIISPWNYPLTLALSDALPALAAGNAVILKPAEQTSLAALWAAELLERCGLPPGLFQVIPGRGPDVGAALADACDFLQFTGSSAVGRRLAARAGERLIPCSMELGGKNALLVLEDTHPRRAARAAVKAFFANAGQLCVSAERLYVHQSRYADFLDHFLREVASLRLGRGFGFDYDIGPMINVEQLRKVEGHVEDARAKGARVRLGGRRREDVGPLAYEPTVLEGVTPEMAVYGQETFGPVVSVYPVDSDREAVALANQGEYGLHACVMSGNEPRATRVAAQIRAGSVSINDGYPATWGSTAAPQGGEGASGLGRRHGPEGLLKYTRSQTVAASRIHPIRPPKGVGMKAYVRTLHAALRVLFRLGVR